jgi:hypothetical protein
MQWFRFYGDAVNDPKVQSLDAPLFKMWVNILCLASKQNGQLVTQQLPFQLRMDNDVTSTSLTLLEEAGLIKRQGLYVYPHNWDKRQFKSDTSAERTKRYRDRLRDVTVTPPDTDTDTEQKRTPLPPKGDVDALWAAWIPYEMVKGNKKKATEAYAKALRKVDASTILTKAIEYCSTCHKLRQKTQHIATWLNQHGWESDTLKPEPDVPDWIKAQR